MVIKDIETTINLLEELKYSYKKDHNHIFEEKIKKIKKYVNQFNSSREDLDEEHPRSGFKVIRNIRKYR